MRRALQHQQIVLKFLGYYDGKCDGIWGPDSVAAMRRFELSGKFNPGCPKNGQPINNYRKLPAGLYVCDRRNNYVSHVDMPDGYIQKHLSEFVIYKEKCDPIANIEGVSSSAVYDPLMSAAVTSNLEIASNEEPVDSSEADNTTEPNVKSTEPATSLTKEQKRQQWANRTNK